MIKTIKYTLLSLFAFSVFTNCQKDDVVIAEVEAMVSEPGDLLNQTFPLNKIRVEGNGLEGLQKITLDDKINVSFNPTYNSDKSFIFTIPFDDKLGSRFGVQPITFVTGKGSVTKNIEILQPVPTIVKTNPAVAKPGFSLEIEGTWFYNVSAVKLGGTSIQYTVASPNTIIINLPANAVSGSDLAITTPGGTVKKTIQFETVVLVADFDGGGTRPGTGWNAYGDVATFSANTSGGPTGNYASFSWAGSQANGYNGSSGGNGGGPGVSFLNSTSTDASRAFIDIDVSASVSGANFAIQLNTIDNVNYGYNFKVTDINWATKTIKITDFKDNYGYGGNAATTLDVSKINEIKIGVVQGDSPNPTTIKFDNIKVRYQ
ncbi:hypothetical protein [Flavobacterium sp.]|uniref:hypothetical protein n=1 Tax=Flavobacterium sp. TaxID=239 RepID=UPI00262DED8B|nr:hypothetical protein [Flavobacterium sp.]MDG2431646.1 hypothetical protein [Flavobacterium sp.]